MDQLPFENHTLDSSFRGRMASHVAEHVKTHTRRTRARDATFKLKKEPEGLEDDFRALMAAEILELSNSRIVLDAPELGDDLVSRYMFAEDGRFAIPLTWKHLVTDLLIIKRVFRTPLQAVTLKDIGKMVYDLETRTVCFRDSERDPLFHMQFSGWQGVEGVPHFICTALLCFLEEEDSVRLWTLNMRCLDTVCKFKLDDGVTVLFLNKTAHSFRKFLTEKVPDFDFKYTDLLDPNDDAIDTVVAACTTLNQLWEYLSKLYFIYLQNHRMSVDVMQDLAQ